MQKIDKKWRSHIAMLKHIGRRIFSTIDLRNIISFSHKKKKIERLILNLLGMFLMVLFAVQYLLQLRVKVQIYQNKT